MAKFQALIMLVDDPGEAAPKRGDIVRVKPLEAKWGKAEGPPRYLPVVLDIDGLHDWHNLTTSITDFPMANFPTAIRVDMRRLIQYARARNPIVKVFRRYRLHHDNFIEDKQSGNVITLNP